MMSKGEGPHGLHIGANPVCAFLYLSKRGTRLEIKKNPETPVILLCWGGDEWDPEDRSVGMRPVQ